MVSLKFTSVEEIVDRDRKCSVVTLSDPVTNRKLTIAAPDYSASYIKMANEKILPERANVYTLVSSMLKAMGISISHITIERSSSISDAFDATANICMKKPGDPGKLIYSILKGKPSDIIPLALLHDAEIRAKEDTLDE
jgi:bifunctional DNase/RNase